MLFFISSRTFKLTEYPATSNITTSFIIVCMHELNLIVFCVMSFWFEQWIDWIHPQCLFYRCLLCCSLDECWIPIVNVVVAAVWSVLLAEKRQRRYVGIWRNRWQCIVLLWRWLLQWFGLDSFCWIQCHVFIWVGILTLNDVFALVSPIRFPGLLNRAELSTWRNPSIVFDFPYVMLAKKPFILFLQRLGHLLECIVLVMARLLVDLFVQWPKLLRHRWVMHISLHDLQVLESILLLLLLLEPLNLSLYPLEILRKQVRIRVVGAILRSKYWRPDKVQRILGVMGLCGVLRDFRYPWQFRENRLVGCNVIFIVFRLTNWGRKIKLIHELWRFSWVSAIREFIHRIIACCKSVVFQRL